MKKNLLAAAVAGLLAVPVQAQINVSTTGRFVGGYDNYRVKDCQTASACRSESRFSDQHSRIVFSVVENLGDGLKAWGQLDSRFNTDVGGDSSYGGINWWAQGNTGLGLIHDGFGRVTLGYWDVYYNELDASLGAPRAQSLQYSLGLGITSQAYNPTPTAGAASAVTLGVGSRTANLLMWDSPNWNGFTARLGYSTNPAGNEGTGVATVANGGNAGGGYAWTAALRYNNGPWAAGYAHWTSKSENRQEVIATGAHVANINDLSGDRVWLGYTFDIGLRLGIAYDRSSNDTGAAGAVGTTRYRRSAWYLPVSYNFGPHAIYASYARAGDASNTAGLDTGASAWNIGYDYAFSRRTAMGIYYTALNNKNGGNYNLYSNTANGSTAIATGAAGFTGAGADARQWYVGMAHSF